MRAQLCVLALALTALGGAAAAESAVDVCEMSNCATVKVDVIGDGNGTGTITSDPAGIDCRIDSGVKSGRCDYQFVWPLSKPGLAVRVTYAAAPGSFFRTSLGPTFPSSYVSFVAGPGGARLIKEGRFELTTHQVDVSTSGGGSGRVVLEGYGECRMACYTKIHYGRKLTLKAVPDDGARFKSWTGACKGRGATCELTITKPIAANAVFDLEPTGGGGSGGPPKDTSVGALIVASQAGKSRLGARRIQVELSLEEDLTVTLGLARKGKLLLSRHFATVREGNRLLTLLVPPRVAGGVATLRIDLADAAGNKRVIRRGTTIPKAGN
jgi:Divergent InlB B-repeat domain